MFPPPEPELCVAAHAGGRRVVRHPQGRPRLGVLQRLPGHLAGGGVHPGPPVQHHVLRLLQDLLRLEPGLGQRQPRHVKVSSESVELRLVGGEDLDHPPLDLVLVGHQAVRVQRTLTHVHPARQWEGHGQLRPPHLGQDGGGRLGRPDLHSGLDLGLRHESVGGLLYVTVSIDLGKGILSREGWILLSGTGVLRAGVPSVLRTHVWSGLLRTVLTRTNVKQKQSTAGTTCSLSSSSSSSLSFPLSVSSTLPLALGLEVTSLMI